MHDVGDEVIYASERYSTAMLEALVHWNGPPPLVGSLIAPKYRLARLPAAELPEHFEWLVPPASASAKPFNRASAKAQPTVGWKLAIPGRLPDIGVYAHPRAGLRVMLMSSGFGVRPAASAIRQCCPVAARYSLPNSLSASHDSLHWWMSVSERSRYFQSARSLTRTIHIVRPPPGGIGLRGHVDGVDLAIGLHFDQQVGSVVLYRYEVRVVVPSGVVPENGEIVPVEANPMRHRIFLIQNERHGPLGRRIKPNLQIQRLRPAGVAHTATERAATILRGLEAAKAHGIESPPCRARARTMVAGRSLVAPSRSTE